MWLIYAFLAAIIWGLSYTLDEQLFRLDITPLTLLATQCWFGTIMFTVLGYYDLKKDMVILANDRHILMLTLVTLLAINFGNFFITLSIKAKNASLAAIVENSYPLFTVAFTYILFKQNQFTVPFAIGGSFILIGLVIISLFSY